MAAKPRHRPDESEEAFAERVRGWREAQRESDRARYQRERARRIKYETDKYHSDPEHRERARQRARERYDSAPPGQACEICGLCPGLTCGGRRGINQDHRHDNNIIRGWLCTKCNHQVAVLDLRFTDPDRFAALESWSLRSAPVVRVVSTHPKLRRRSEPNPTLFEVKLGE